MAAVTLLGTQTFTTASGTKTVTATPAVGDLIVIVTAHTGNTSSTAPTDNNSDGLGTYTLVETAVKASSADTMRLWIRNALIGSASSTVFTHAPGGSSGGGLGVLKVTGMLRTGSAAKLKSGLLSNQSAATPALSWTGGGSGLTGNPKIGAVFNETTTSASMTKPASFDSERFDVGYSSPTTGLEVVSDDSGNTDSTVTWGSASSSAFCAAILELDTTAAPKTAAPGDDNAAQYGDLLGVDRTEQVRWADAVTVDLQIVGGAGLTVSLSDNLNAWADQVISLRTIACSLPPDALNNWTDTEQNGIALLVRPAAETMVQADSLAGFEGLRVEVSDNLAGYNDALLITSGAQKVAALGPDNLNAWVDQTAGAFSLAAIPAADNLHTWADSQKNIAGLIVALSDAKPAYADSTAASAQIVVSLSDSLPAYTDNTTLSVGLLAVPAADGMAQADTLAGFETLRLQASDGLAGYADTVMASTGAQKFAALGPDNLANYTDSTAVRYSISVGLTDSALFVADASALSSAKSAALTDGLAGYADTLAVSAGAAITRSFTDSALFAADIAASRLDLLSGYVLWLVDESGNRIVDENGLGFAITGLADGLFNYSDQATVDRQSVGTTPITKSFTDNLAAYGDQLNRIESLRVQPAADQMSQADLLAIATGGQISVSLSDSMAQADALALRADLRAAPAADSLVNYLDLAQASGEVGQLFISFLESPLAYSDALRVSISVECLHPWRILDGESLRAQAPSLSAYFADPDGLRQRVRCPSPSHYDTVTITDPEQ